MSAREETARRQAVLEVGRDESGFVVRITGRGSMRESAALREWVLRALAISDDAELTVDLSSCEYLDSTFLGCLVGLHKQCNSRGVLRVQIAASADKLGDLFGPTGLDRILPRRAFADDAVREWVRVPVADLDPRTLGRHLMECHRRLAEAGGPQAATFAAIADQLERELGADRRS